MDSEATAGPGCIFLDPSPDSSLGPVVGPTSPGSLSENRQAGRLGAACGHWREWFRAPLGRISASTAGFGRPSGYTVPMATSYTPPTSTNSSSPLSIPGKDDLEALDRLLPDLDTRLKRVKDASI